MIARRLLAALVLFLLWPWQAMAQAPSAVRILDSNGVPIGPANPMPITGGSSGGTSAVDNSTFIGGTTSITPMGALYDTTPPPITDGNVGVPRMDANRILMVNCQSGCAGASGDGTSQGPLGALNDAVSIALSTYHGAAVNFSGTAITGTVVAEGSNDGGATYPFQVWFLHPATGVLSTSLTNPSGGDYSFAWVGAISHVRVRVSAFTSGGPLTARLRTTATNTISIMVGSDGSNLRVLKTDTSGNLAMDVADRATRKVGQVFLRNPGDTANMGDAATPVRVDPTGTTTQPVSGTVTANQGSPAGQANRWPVFLSDGAAERGTAANPLRVDPTGTTAQPVSGTVSANLNAGSNLVGKVQLRNPGNTADLGDATNPVRVDPTGTTTQPVSGTVSANLNAGSNLVGKVQLRNPGNTADLGDAANPIRIDPTGTTTQPVSGTVTANAGTGTFTVAGTVTANAGTGTFIVDQLDTASLDYDTGAGTVNQTVVGIALPGPGGPVAGGTSSNPIRIDPTGTTTQPVSGTVTANAGTGTFATNLSQYGGASVGAGNAIHVQPGTGATFTVTQSTASNLNATVTGTVNAAQSGTWTVVDGGAGKTLKRAVVSLTATGTVVAAVASRRIKIYQYAIQSRNDSMTVRFRDGSAGSNLSLDWLLNTREGAQSGPVNPPAFIFGTSAGNSLDAVVSGTGTVWIEVSYWDDDAT